MQVKTKHDVLAVMVQHCGEDKAISSQELAVKVGVGQRKLRELITECRLDGTPICGHPATGYFVARSQAELEKTIEFLIDRAKTSLKLASVLSNRPMGDFVGQLHINA